MNPNASPGPDGFGPAFYRKFWPLLKSSLLPFFYAFHDLSVDVERFNRALMILLPKKDVARTADAFRPISLQNCPTKAIAKLLTNRLKPLIPLLVHGDQTGFINGRSMAENFVYAADLTSCCHIRKASTMIIKLDFRKAFDSISWDSLLTILHYRGFSRKWCSWIQTLLSSGKTAVLLNGVPGHWINCKNGLRQGDPLSPYLFIIVADLLQRQILQAHNVDSFHHPLFHDRPPSVLQYADDTLIIAHASPEAAEVLKTILDDFALATGLAINFHKTTFVPLHTDPTVANAIASHLGCPVSSFPQTYLGLPLSHTKLPASVFHPIIATFYKFLSGWAAGLLSRGARLTLISSVLDSLPVYFMSVFRLPKKVLKELDAIRRAFFWTADKNCTGAQCLVAWKNVCKPKNCGGLGIKNLLIQNNCLLMKFAFKLLQQPDLPWVHWYHYRYTTAIADNTSKPSFIWKVVNHQLPILQKNSFVFTNNGQSTFFWLDTWIHHQPLYLAFPHLFSHSTNQTIMVSYVLQNGLLANLRNRLTTVASAEFAIVLSLLQDYQQNDAADNRYLTHGLSFSTKNAYHLLAGVPAHDTNDTLVWASRVPIKVQVFGWLLFKDRLNSKANLFRKTIVHDTTCARCTAPYEDAAHIFLQCPDSVAIWAALQLPMPASIDDIWDIATPPGQDDDIWPSVALTILWKIWDSRNSLVFRGNRHSARVTLQNIVHDFTVWTARFRGTLQKVGAMSWRQYLSSRASATL